MSGFSGKEKELAERMKEHGYTLYRIKYFKNFDRLHFGNQQINISLNLRGKLSELALETLIEACIGKGSERLMQKQSLKEKAKTTLQIAKELAYEENVFSDEKVTEYQHMLWVRLEDAEEEVKQKQVEVDEAKLLFIQLNAKFEEWKQKLREILPELDLEDKWHVNPMMNRIRKIIEELLE